MYLVFFVFSFISVLYGQDKPQNCIENDADLAKELYNRQCEQFAKQIAIDADHKEGWKRAYDLVGDVAGKRILFVGCGDGAECKRAVEQGAHVVGIDISDKSIELARKCCPQAEFHVMDFTRITFLDESFDSVMVLFAAMYAKDLAQFLQKLKSVLKPGGMLVLVVPHPVGKMIKHNNFDYFVKGKRHEESYGIERFNYYRLFEDYIDAFVQAGIKLLQIQEPRPAQALHAEFMYPRILVFKLVKGI